MEVPSPGVTGEYRMEMISSKIAHSLPQLQQHDNLALQMLKMCQVYNQILCTRCHLSVNLLMVKQFKLDCIHLRSCTRSIFLVDLVQNEYVFDAFVNFVEDCNFRNLLTLLYTIVDEVCF